MMEARPLVCVHVCVCVWVGGARGHQEMGYNTATKTLCSDMR